MAEFIARKRSSVCIMAKLAGAETIAVDMGMFLRVDEPDLLEKRIGDGTADMTRGPAMSRSQALAAIETGIELAQSCRGQGYQFLRPAEWGWQHDDVQRRCFRLLGKSPAEMTGSRRGAGWRGPPAQSGGGRAGVCLQYAGPERPGGRSGQAWRFRHCRNGWRLKGGALCACR
jgi:hypothetical protein